MTYDVNKLLIPISLVSISMNIIDEGIHANCVYIYISEWFHATTSSQSGGPHRYGLSAVGTQG
jgi:hypothetical protein